MPRHDSRTRPPAEARSGSVATRPDHDTPHLRQLADRAVADARTAGCACDLQTNVLSPGRIHVEHEPVCSLPDSVVEETPPVIIPPRVHRQPLAEPGQLRIIGGTETSPPASPPDPKPEPVTLDDRFYVWSARNEDLIRLLVKLARQWHEAGHKRCAVSLLVERARWEYGLRGRGSDFAIDNSFRSRLAREIARRAPELGPRFFTYRTMPSRGGRR